MPLALLALRVLAAVSSITADIGALGGSAGVASLPAAGRTTAVLFEVANQRLLDVKRRRGRGRPRRAA